jgi:hypothetical protein
MMNEECGVMSEGPKPATPIKTGRGREGGRVEFEPARFEAQWVDCANARNLDVTMDLLERSSGEGRFIGIQGLAGTGRTRSSQRWAAHSRCIHLLMRPTWRKSPHGFLQALCRELGMMKPPWGSDACMSEVIERMVVNPRPVFLDEFDLVPQQLDLVRVLAELTAAPFVLIGENLAGCMTRNRRVWSRTYHWVEFKPVDTREIVSYASKTGGLEITSPAAEILKRDGGGGDWRNVKRLTIELVEIANNQRTRVVSESMARQAARMILKGQQTIRRPSDGQAHQ